MEVRAPEHFGSSKTLCRPREGFYWGQHWRDVEDFCRCCDGCVAYKGLLDQSHAPAGFWDTDGKSGGGHIGSIP